MVASNYQKVTMLDDLPDLQDIEGDFMGPAPHNRGVSNGSINQPRYPPADDILPPETNGKYDKFIRNHHQFLPESGMSHRMPPQEMFGPPPPQMTITPEMYEDQVRFASEENKKIHNCIDICNHINDCPICSKFYSNDKTVYVIAIVVLSIICILLLKRVLDL